jgi:hypothetical protein
MKTKFVKRIMVPLVVACALFPLLTAAAPPQGGAAGGLQGTWEMQISQTDCAGHVIRSFPTLIEFIPGGIVTEASGGTAPALQTGGKGVWRQISDHTYAFRFKDFTFNTQNIFTGWVIIAGTTTVDKTGNANSGPATVDVYDPNGVLIVHLCAEAAGTRFEL